MLGTLCGRITAGNSAFLLFLQSSGIDLTEQLIQILRQFFHLVISGEQIPVFVVTISDFQKQTTFRICNSFQKKVREFKDVCSAPLRRELQVHCGKIPGGYYLTAG